MAKATEKEKEKGTCKTCRFGAEQGDMIDCHRFPPVSDGNGTNSEDQWPLVAPDGWCGEYSEWQN